MVVVRRAMETSSLRRENKELKQKEAIDFELIEQATYSEIFLSSLKKCPKQIVGINNRRSRFRRSCGFIHANSKQSSGHFIDINCSTSDEDI